MALTDDHAVDYKVRSINVATGGISFGAGGSGTSNSATTATPTVNSFLTGTVLVPIGTAAASGTNNVTATVAGMTTNHKVFVMPLSNPTTFAIVAAVCGTNLLTVSALNTRDATAAAATATASFFAWT